MKKFLILASGLLFLGLPLTGKETRKFPEMKDDIRLEIRKGTECLEVYEILKKENGDEISVCNEVLLKNSDLNSIQFAPSQLEKNSYILYLFPKDDEITEKLFVKDEIWVIYINDEYITDIRIGTDSVSKFFYVTLGDAEQTEKLIGTKLFDECKKALGK